MKKVRVSNTFALVDDQGYELVSRYTWQLWKGPQRSVYAVTSASLVSDWSSYCRMHWLIMGSKSIDHKDGNGLNNRRDNLRLATKPQNAANSIKRQKASSRYKGVTWSSANGKWKAQIMKDRKNISLGNFTSETEAAKAYDGKTKQLFGEYARLNFPEES